MGELDNERKWCVYMHVNKTNNKIYVGITSRAPEKRWGKNGSGYSKEDQFVFYRAIKKYGWDGFEHIIFAESLTADEAKHMEKLLIAFYKTNCCRYRNPEYGYNMTDGGDGCFGHIMSEEAKQKIREKATGRVWSEEQKENLREKYKHIKNPFLGKTHSDETKRVIGDKAKERLSDKTNHPMYGKTQSKESNLKNMMSQKNRSPVIQMDLQGNVIAEFGSILDAHRCVGICRSDISLCCHKKKESAGGFLWSFKNSEDINKQSMAKTLHTKKVIKLDLEENFLYEYISVSEASRQTSVFVQNICACCTGKQKSAGGFKWMYKEDYDKLTQQND